jgi:SagB-type dehydrogenase family enzyme
MTLIDKTDIAAKIIGYHEETKHHYHRYARSARHMDWDNQPNPFRFYEDTESITLPFLKKDPDFPYMNLYQRDNRRCAQLALETIGGFLELALGLSAWKAAGSSRWPLRMNPSSGNLHPTEAHLILPGLEGVRGGVYHYNSLHHMLEERALVSARIWDEIGAHFGCEGFLIGLTSIFWRESWKYGERAFRYCNLDAGHALAAVSFSANLFGWTTSYLSGLTDGQMRIVLGFDKTGFHDLEAEHPDLMCFVHRVPAPKLDRRLPAAVIEAFEAVPFTGRPNRLSSGRPVNWEIIYQTARLTRKPAAAEHHCEHTNQKHYRKDDCRLPAAAVIRQRRSATAYDREKSITYDQFLAIVDKTLPRDGCAPFDVELTEPMVHLMIFVHQVDDLAPGLYVLIRAPKALEPIMRMTRSQFLWTPVENDYPLFLLEKGDFRQTATMVSCHQDIAGHSAFSIGMIAAFKAPVERHPFSYPRLFWESGMIGQVLYLAAEAQGLRGTGIGCFFDNGVHELLGFEDNRYQSLYHFTIGHPIEDLRLTSYPPYYHLDLGEDDVPQPTHP